MKHIPPHHCLSPLFLFLSLLAGCGSGGGGDEGAFAHSVNLTGTIRYEDRLYDRTGFTSETAFKPVRRTVVQLVSSLDEILATTETDENGAYSVAGTGVQPRLRVLAKTGPNATQALEVRSPVNGALLAVVTAALPEGTQELNINVPAAPAGGAFNVIDVMSSAAQFLASLSGNMPPALRVFWEPGSTDGTYFCSACGAFSGIHLRSLTSNGFNDLDEYDDDVVLHEYGHFVEAAFGTGDSLGGPHFLTDLSQDLRLAWSEGWASFFEGATKQWLLGNAPQRLSTSLPSAFYVDTISGTASYFDFAHVPPQIQYASNEASVAQTLWNVTSAESFSMQTVWSVFSGYLPGLSPLRPSSMETFWDGWVNGFAPDPTLLAAMRNVLSAQSIHYSEDGNEPDGTFPDQASPLVPGETVTSTLFLGDGTDDRDLFAFSASQGSSYRIETYDLRNGTDTWLRVLDISGAPVAENDNHATFDDLSATQTQNVNDGCTLASRISFTPELSGTYYVEVTASPEVPLAAGHYGSYTLKIGENPASPPQCQV